MKFKIARFGAAFGLTWGLMVLGVGLGNIFFPGYGDKFLEIVDSIYPGYSVGKWGIGGVLVGTVYALADGFILGVIFAWIYNKLSGSK